MRTILTVIGLLLGLFAALFAADRGIKFVKENNRRYVSLAKREESDK